MPFVRACEMFPITYERDDSNNIHTYSAQGTQI